MTKVYMIANITIEDADEYRKYEKGFFPILKKHGGEFVTFDDSMEHFEGRHRFRAGWLFLLFPPNKRQKTGMPIRIIRRFLNFDALAQIWPH